MLTQLLPGVRDLRTPLAVGSTWLATLWLMLSPTIPIKLEDAPPSLRPSYELLAALGSVGILSMLSFIAYLLGVVAMGFTRPLIDLPVRFLVRILELPAPGIGPHSRMDQMLVAAILYGGTRFANGEETRKSWASLLIRWSAVRDESSTAQALGPFAPDLPNLEGIDDSKLREALDLWIQALGDSIMRRPNLRNQIILDAVDGDYYRARYDDELQALPSRLITSHPQIFERWDRLDSEAEFRLHVALPSLAILAASAHQLSGLPGVWEYASIVMVAAGAIISILLARAGIEKRSEANTQLVQALLIVKSEVIEEAGNGVIAWRNNAYNENADRANHAQIVDMLLACELITHSQAVAMREKFKGFRARLTARRASSADAEPA